LAITINGSTGITYPDSSTQATGEGLAKAWVNFNGTGVVAIRADFNVSSITDNGVGDYTVNFTNAMLDAKFAAAITSKAISGSNSTPGQINFSDTGLTSSVRLWFSSYTSSTTGTDRDTVDVAIFR